MSDFLCFREVFLKIILTKTGRRDIMSKLSDAAANWIEIWCGLRLTMFGLVVTTHMLSTELCFIQKS